MAMIATHNPHLASIDAQPTTDRLAAPFCWFIWAASSAAMWAAILAMFLR